MTDRIRCLAAFASICLLATAATAQTRGGAQVTVVARHAPSASLQRSVIVPRAAAVIDLPRESERRRGPNRGTIAAWPYPWSPDAGPIQAAEPPTPHPTVIVLSNAAPSHAALPSPPEDRLPDYSYVPGCHAIPGGYHCDIAHNAPASP
jgi:hypothetical protein